MHTYCRVISENLFPVGAAPNLQDLWHCEELGEQRDTRDTSWGWCCPQEWGHPSQTCKGAGQQICLITRAEGGTNECVFSSSQYIKLKFIKAQRDMRRKSV